jgi:hypothetical protein
MLALLVLVFPSLYFSQCLVSILGGFSVHMVGSLWQDPIVLPQCISSLFDHRLHFRAADEGLLGQQCAISMALDVDCCLHQKYFAEVNRFRSRMKGLCKGWRI